LSEQLVTLERESIVSKLSEGLAATQVSKLKKLSEDITWESAESFEKKVKIIKESYFAKKSTVEETVEEVTEEVDNSQTIEKVTVEEVEPQGSTLDPVMERYIKASVKLQKEAHGDIGKYLQ
jgi:predicted RND superfamily exporter protein